MADQERVETNPQLRLIVISVFVVLIVAGIVLGTFFGTDTQSGEIAAQPSAQIWSCPDLPQGDGAGAEIGIANATDAAMKATVQFYPDEGDKPAPVETDVPANGRIAVKASDHTQVSSAATVELPPGEAAVGVTITRSGAAKGIATYPCAASASEHVYFASGNTSRGNSQFLTIFNPGAQAAVLDATYVTSDGREEKVINVGAQTRVNLDLGSSEDILGRRDSVATILKAQAGRVVATQTVLPGGGAAGFGVALGAPAGGSQAFFPGYASSEGSAAAVSALNLSGVDDNVMTQFTPDAGKESLPPTETDVGAYTAAALDLAPLVGAGAFGIHAIGDREFVAQLSGPVGQGVADMIGVAEAAGDWLIPWQAATSDGGRIWIQNPGGEESTLQFYALTSAGSDEPVPVGEAVNLPPLARSTVTVESLGLAEASAGLLVRLSEPGVIAHVLVSGSDISLSPAITSR